MRAAVSFEKVFHWTKFLAFEGLPLKAGLGPWTLKNVDPKKPGPWKTWTLKHWTLKSVDPKNLDHEKRGKQLDVEKWLENYIV